MKPAEEVARELISKYWESGHADTLEIKIAEAITAARIEGAERMMESISVCGDCIHELMELDPKEVVR